VADADEVALEQRRGPEVVGVVVRVHEEGDLVGHSVLGGDLVDGPLQVVPDGRRGVEEDHALGCGEERRHVHAVGDPVGVALDPSQVEALLVERGTERGRRDRREVGLGRGAAGAGGRC
jgi:hypothetical protein